MITFLALFPVMIKPPIITFSPFCTEVRVETFKRLWRPGGGVGEAALAYRETVICPNFVLASLPRRTNWWTPALRDQTFGLVLPVPRQVIDLFLRPDATGMSQIMVEAFGSPSIVAKTELALLFGAFTLMATTYGPGFVIVNA